MKATEKNFESVCRFLAEFHGDMGEEVLFNRDMDLEKCFSWIIKYFDAKKIDEPLWTEQQIKDIKASLL